MACVPTESTYRLILVATPKGWLPLWGKMGEPVLPFVTHPIQSNVGATWMPCGMSAAKLGPCLQYSSARVQWLA